jgi:hypothetical protein
MKKWVQNYILFVIMFLLGLFQAVSGFLLWMVIPGGHRGFGIGRGSQLTDANILWSRYTWIELHDWVAVALLVMLIIHIIRHRKWVFYATRKVFSLR